MSLLPKCTCELVFEYDSSCPRHAGAAQWLKKKLADREAALRDLRQQALTRPVHGGYPGEVPSRRFTCCNVECEWEGPLTETCMLGGIGPLCPRCREVVE